MKNLLFICLLMSAAATRASFTSPHLAIYQGDHLTDQPCLSCHINEIRSDSTLSASHELTASQETLCSDCHENAVRVSHPSGFTPDSLLPNGFPVNDKGQMTCSTCHETHGNTQGLLRGDRRGKEFCMACHDESFFSAMTDAGTSLFLSAHIETGQGSLDDTMDSFSLQCLGCHDSNVPEDSSNIRNHTRGGNHPVGIQYNRNASYGGYVPIDQVTETLFLPDERVSCVTCHDGYSKGHGMIVAQANTVGLCSSCHDL